MMNRKLRMLLKNGGLFLLLLALTIYMVLKDNSPAALAEAAAKADWRYLTLAVGAMGVFLLCEGVNIARCLRFFGTENLPWRRGVKYALIGFFGSSVTPSASGGQPLQLYYMHRDGIRISHGAMALLFELLSFQTVTIVLAAAGYFYQHRTITAAMGNLQYLLLIGIGVNALVMGLLICTIFSGKIVGRLAGIVVKLVKSFSRQRAEVLEQKLAEQIEEYRQIAVYLKAYKGIFVKTAATTSVQILAMYTVPFLVYSSFGLSRFTAAEVISLQAVLYVAVSAIPLPGALGVSESAFMMLFQALFSAGLLPSAMLLSRGISFYLFVLVSGLATAFFTITGKGKRYGVHHFNRRGRSGYCSTAEALSGKQRLSDRCGF